jgi:hypothetical protein
MGCTVRRSNSGGGEIFRTRPDSLSLSLLHTHTHTHSNISSLTSWNEFQWWKNENYEKLSNLCIYKLIYGNIKLFLHAFLACSRVNFTFTFILKMQTAYFCYTLVRLRLCQTSRRHIPQDRILRNHSYEIFISQAMSINLSVLESVHLSESNLKIFFV